MILGSVAFIHDIVQETVQDVVRMQETLLYEKDGNWRYGVGCQFQGPKWSKYIARATGNYFPRSGEKDRGVEAIWGWSSDGVIYGKAEGLKHKKYWCENNVSTSTRHFYDLKYNQVFAVDIPPASEVLWWDFQTRIHEVRKSKWLNWMNQIRLRNLLFQWPALGKVMLPATREVLHALHQRPSRKICVICSHSHPLH